MNKVSRRLGLRERRGYGRIVQSMGKFSIKSINTILVLSNLKSCFLNRNLGCRLLHKVQSIDQVWYNLVELHLP